MNLLVCAAVSFNKPFYATDLFLYPLKALEDVWFSDVFREYRIRSVASKKIDGQDTLKSETVSSQLDDWKIHST